MHNGDMCFKNVQAEKAKDMYDQMAKVQNFLHSWRRETV